MRKLNLAHYIAEFVIVTFATFNIFSRLANNVNEFSGVAIYNKIKISWYVFGLNSIGIKFKNPYHFTQKPCNGKFY